MAFDVQILDQDRIYGVEELGARGLARWEISRLMQRGLLSSHGTGTYVHHAFVPGAHDDLAVLAIRCPSAVFNISTAADLHGMNNRNLPGIYVGIPAAQRAPMISRNFATNLYTTRWSREQDVLVGIEERIIRGVTIKLTDPERTVCDMWRYSFHNPGLRGNPSRVGDEALEYCMNAYLDQVDGATSALADMMSSLEVSKSTEEAFIQYLRVYSAGYSRNRVF